ncbi:hypothetical protein Tco_1448700 [Tanacetum coccineum]
MEHRLSSFKLAWSALTSLIAGSSEGLNKVELCQAGFGNGGVNFVGLLHPVVSLGGLVLSATATCVLLP